MKAPFVKLLLGDTDFSERVESFRFEDSVEDEDAIAVTISCKTPADIDAPEFEIGRTATFTFGYMGGMQSGRYVGRISEFNPKFQQNILAELQISDFSVVMKKEASGRVWNGQTTSQIARTLAEENQLEYVGMETTHKWDEQSQGQRSDMDFLRGLVKKDPGGPFLLTVSQRDLRLERYEYEAPSALTLRFGDPNGALLSFSASMNDRKDKGGAGGTAAVGTETPIQTTDEDASRGALGPALVSYQGQTGGRIPRADAENRNGEAVPSPSADQAAAQGVAKSAQQEAKQKILEASMTIEGNPAIRAGQVITVLNVGNRFSGNYYINRVTHTLGGGRAYITTLDTHKTGTNAPARTGAATAEDGTVNNTTGPNNAETKKPLVTYSGQSGKKI
jgi:phage protein D